MYRKSLVSSAFALILALAATTPASATTVFCAEDEGDLYAAFAAGTFVNDDVEVRLYSRTFWLNKELRFDNYYGRRLELKGGYSGIAGGHCNVRVWGADRTTIRAAYVSGFDVRLYSGRRIAVENLSFEELDEVVIDVHGGHADVDLNMVRVEGTGGLTIDTTDADNSTVDIWNLAVLRSYEAPAVNMILDDTDLNIFYATIYDNDNTGAEVGGLYLDAYGDSQLDINRSVLWDNGPVDVYVDFWALSGSNNIIDIVEYDDSGSFGFIVFDDIDPRLDYEGAPLSNSPCLNAATQTTSIPRDILGRPRVRGSRSDIGAFEGPLD